MAWRIDHLYTKPIAVQLVALEVIPQYETALDLSKNYLGYYSLEDLGKIQTKLNSRTSLKELDLSWNSLYVLSRKELGFCLSNLSGSLTMLRLRGNGLGPLSKSSTSLPNIYGRISSSIQGIDLSHNHLGRFPDFDPGPVLQIVSDNRLFLDISHNALGNLVTTKLINGVSSLYPGLEILGLSHNLLDQKSPNELGNIMRVLPPMLHTLDLSGHQFSEMQLLEMLPELRVKTLHLDIDHLGEETRLMIKSMFHLNPARDTPPASPTRSPDSLFYYSPIKTRKDIPGVVPPPLKL